MTVSSDRDKVRLMLGDTQLADPLLYDDEIDAFLSDRSVLDTNGGTVANVIAAAADAAGAIAAKYSREFNFAEDGQSFQVAMRVGHYQGLEKTLRARAGGGAVPLSLAGTASLT